MSHPAPYRFHHSARPEALPVMRDEVREAIAEAHCDQRRLDDLLVAVSEATTNAVRHGESTEIEIEVEVSDAVVRVRVRDNGHGLVHDGEADMPNPNSMGGRGLPLMHLLVDSCEVSRTAAGGTEVLLQIDC